jgi:hypothetical protein
MDYEWSFPLVAIPYFGEGVSILTREKINEMIKIAFWTSE